MERPRRLWVIPLLGQFWAKFHQIKSLSLSLSVIPLWLSWTKPSFPGSPPPVFKLSASCLPLALVKALTGCVEEDTKRRPSRASQWSSVVLLPWGKRSSRRVHSISLVNLQIYLQTSLPWAISIIFVFLPLSAFISMSSSSLPKTLTAMSSMANKSPLGKNYCFCLAAIVNVFIYLSLS